MSIGTTLRLLSVITPLLPEGTATGTASEKVAAAPAGRAPRAVEAVEEDAHGGVAVTSCGSAPDR